MAAERLFGGASMAGAGAGAAGGNGATSTTAGDSGRFGFPADRCDRPVAHDRAGAWRQSEGRDCRRENRSAGRTARVREGMRRWRQKPWGRRSRRIASLAPHEPQRPGGEPDGRCRLRPVRKIFGLRKGAAHRPRENTPAPAGWANRIRRCRLTTTPRRGRGLGRIGRQSAVIA